MIPADDRALAALRGLLDRPRVVLAEIPYPDLPYKTQHNCVIKDAEPLKNPDGTLLTQEQWEHCFYGERCQAPYAKALVVFGIEAPMLSGCGQITFACGLRRKSVFDAREEFHFYLVPPRQSYGVWVNTWEREKAGLVLIRGWEVDPGDFFPNWVK